MTKKYELMTKKYELMAKRFLSMLVILGGVLTFSAVAQRSAEAVMPVSVQIVKAVNVETSFLDQIVIDQMNKNQFDVGSIILKDGDFEGTIISIPSEVKIVNETGEELSFKLTVETEDVSRNNRGLKFAGSVIDSLPQPGNYMGKFVTTVEYL